MSTETPVYNMPVEFCGFPRKYLHELVVGHSYNIRGRHFEWAVRITERHATQIVVLLVSYATRRLHDGVSQFYVAEPGNYRVIPIALIDERIDQDDSTGTQQFYHFFQSGPPPDYPPPDYSPPLIHSNNVGVGAGGTGGAGAGAGADTGGTDDTDDNSTITEESSIGYG